MRRVQTLEALVFSRRNVGEADRLVTLFTREMGLIRVLAKGVRKIPSRRGGHLEPLTVVKASVAGKDGRWFLAGVETVDYLSSLRGDEKAQAAAQALAQLAVGFFEYEVAYPAVFAAIKRAWVSFVELNTERRWLLETAVVMLVLREAGVMLRLKMCGVCGETEPPERLCLDPIVNGWACMGCSRGAQLALKPHDLQCLRQMARGPGGVLRLVRGENESGARLGRAVRQYARDSVFAVSY